MSEPKNKTTPPRPSGEVWPEISRLRGKIASLELQLTESLKNQLRSEETISQLLSQIPQASTEDSSVVQTDTPRTDASLTEQEAFVPKGLLECCRALELELQLQKEITNGWLISREVIIQERDGLQAELKASQAQSHGMSRRVVEAEMKLEIANKDLRASEAEVERLTEKLTSLQEAYLQSVERDKSLTQALFDSKAEVARLRSQRNRAIEIAEMFRQVKGLHHQCNCAMCQLLGDLKGELK